MAELKSGVMEANAIKEGDPVPHEIVPCHVLPPLTWKKEIPECNLTWKQMIGPSVILAGMGLGSGESVLWPYVAAHYGFGLFWAAVIGVITQYILNLEIERWSLVTGETVLTGFARTGRAWPWVYLACTIIPYFWPGWATGAGAVMSWFVGGSTAMWAVIGLLAVGVALSLGPVLYNTMEKIQTVLVLLIMVIVVIAGVITFDANAYVEFAKGAVSFGYMPEGIDMAFVLGAIAYAGVGGAGNLAQSNYIRDKGYAMGKYVGRITSPITGKPETIPATGYWFPQTEENVNRFKKWFSEATKEHFVVFFIITIVSIVVMSAVAYSTVHGMDLGEGMDFIKQEGLVMEQMLGPWFRVMWWLAVWGALMSTALGVLEMSARLTSDIIKTNWLRHNEKWTVSKLFYTVLWFQITCGVIILGAGLSQPVTLLVIGASLNGIVMFLYSTHLLWINTRILPKSLGPSAARYLVMLWAVAFFGYFSMKLIADIPSKLGLV